MTGETSEVGSDVRKLKMLYRLQKKEKKKKRNKKKDKKNESKGSPYSWRSFAPLVFILRALPAIRPCDPHR